MLNFEGVDIPEEIQNKLNEQVSGLISEKVEAEVTGLKGKVDELLTEKKNEKAKRDQEKLERAKLEEEQARKNGDLEAIDKSWSEKYQKLLDEFESFKGNSNELVRGLTVGQEVSRMAAELGGENANGLLPHLKSRLDVDPSTGDIKVLDVNGKPSALTIEELKSEIKETPYLAPLLIGTKAGGAGSGSSSTSGAGVDGNKTSADKIADRINQRFNKLG
jgi:hypothetical protein